MLDAKAYKAHFPDDPAYELPLGLPRQLNSAALMEALARGAFFRPFPRESGAAVLGAPQARQPSLRLSSPPLWRRNGG
jgi:hypothetical protein